MGEQFFHDGNLTDILKILIFLSGAGFLAVALFAWILGKLVALKQKPVRRARWTAGIAYACAAVLFIFAFGSAVPPWLAPLVPVPGAIVIYLWLRAEYLKAWIDDDQVPDGTKLEHNDWRVGLGIIVTVVAVAALKALLRHL